MEIGDEIEIEGVADAPSGSAHTRRRAKNKQSKRGRQGSNGNGNGNGNRQLELRRLLAGLKDLCGGDFSVRLPESADPMLNDIMHEFNTIAERNQAVTNELRRVATTVGSEGRMHDRAFVPDVEGGWRSMIGSVNSLITDLVQPTTEVARVLTAVAEGDHW